MKGSILHGVCRVSVPGYRNPRLAKMGIESHVDNSCQGASFERVQQQVGKQEISQVIDREVHLDAAQADLAE
jgi:hypothetical protein